VVLIGKHRAAKDFVETGITRKKKNVDWATACVASESSTCLLMAHTREALTWGDRPHAFDNRWNHFQLIYKFDHTAFSYYCSGIRRREGTGSGTRSACLDEPG
jgi:hypothetical protein